MSRPARLLASAMIGRAVTVTRVRPIVAEGLVIAVELPLWRHTARLLRGRLERGGYP